MWCRNCPLTAALEGHAGKEPRAGLLPTWKWEPLSSAALATDIKDGDYDDCDNKGDS